MYIHEIVTKYLLMDIVDEIFSIIVQEWTTFELGIVVIGTHGIHVYMEIF